MALSPNSNNGPPVFICDVAGIMHHVGYTAHERDLLSGVRLELEPDPLNRFDAYAVKVLHDGDQIGWIPKCHSQKVVNLIKDGGAMYAVIAHHNRCRSLHDTELQIELRHIKASNRYWAGHSVQLTKDQHKGEKLREAPVGQLLRLRTDRQRTSISVVGIDGADVGWFRKSEMDAKIVEDLENCIVSGVVAVKVQCHHPTTLQFVPINPAKMEPPEVKTVLTGGNQLGKTSFIKAWLEENAQDFQYVMSSPGLLQWKATGYMPMDPDSETPAQRAIRSALVAARNQGRDPRDPLWSPPDHQIDCDLYMQAALNNKLRYVKETTSGVGAADASNLRITTTSKETTMNSKINSIIASNKESATTAAVLEAGRIANNQVAKLAAKKLPMMVRGYADTPMGKLVIANIAQQAALHFRPEDATVKALTDAMQTQAYIELIQTVNLEEFIDGLMDSPEIKRAVKKLDVTKDSK